MLSSESRGNQWYRVLETLSTKPWFYLVLFLLFFLPPYVEGRFVWWSSAEDSAVGFLGDITEAMFAYTDLFLVYMPALHFLFVLNLLGLLIWRARYSRWFSLAVGLNFLLITYLQTMVVTEQYGFFLATNFFLPFLLVTFLWFWEAFTPQTQYRFQTPAWPSVGMIALAIFAFWNPESIWDPDPRNLLTSNSVITFCHMVPVYLAILHLQLPHVNSLLYRTMSYLGILMIPIVLGVGLHLGGTAGADWVLLHTPLLLIPPYCLWDDWRSRRNQA